MDPEFEIFMWVTVVSYPASALQFSTSKTEINCCNVAASVENSLHMCPSFPLSVSVARCALVPHRTPGATIEAKLRRLVVYHEVLALVVVDVGDTKR